MEQNQEMEGHSLVPRPSITFTVHVYNGVYNRMPGNEASAYSHG